MPRRRVNSTAIFTALSVCLLVPASSVASVATTVTTSPSLKPTFAKSITDYTTTCVAGTVSVTTNAPSSTAFRVDGKAVKKGLTTTRVRLAAGQRFKMISGAGPTAVTHSVRCLPTDFPTWTASGTLPKTVPLMAFSVAPVGSFEFPYVVITDPKGVPVWWMHTPNKSSMDVKVVPGGNIGFFGGYLVGDTGSGPFSVYRPDGTKVRDVQTVSGTGDPHETLPTVRGTYYRIAGVNRPHIDLSAIGGGSDRLVRDNVIEEISPEGTVLWSWSTLDHVGISEMGRWGPLVIALSAEGAGLDLMHMNSIEEDGTGLVVSVRHLDAVFRINKSDGSIDWRLGGTNTPQSLSVLGDPAYVGATFGGQHDARMQPDGTITVYDNGSGYTGRAPRAVRWRVDKVARTASLVEQLDDPLIASSFAAGGARRLTDGSWLVAWCHQPYVRAYNAAHTSVFSMKFGGGARTYRAVPVTTAQLTKAQLVAGMDKMFPR